MNPNGQSPQPKKDGKLRDWAPRMWMGMNFSGWIRLLIRYRFAVDWRYLYIAVIDTCTALFINTPLYWLKELFYHRRISKTLIKDPPIFIIGHWRTGTTLLHELLTLDERHTFPNYYQCFVPNHFLLTERYFKKWLRFLMPSHRPMDNMEAGWDKPQEDEFALCNLGLPSPYLSIAFPNHPLQFREYLDLEDVEPNALARWKRGFLRFLKELSFKNPKRIVLKSPPHTCRIKILLDLFPEARFVHIVRNPYVIFPSTMHLWKSLYRAHGLQRPKFSGLEDLVYETFCHFSLKFDQGKVLVKPTRFFELRYEDLIADPIGKLQALYEHLELGDFEKVLPEFRRYWKKFADYQTNRYRLPQETKEGINKRWGKVLKKYGYSLDGLDL